MTIEQYIDNWHKQEIGVRPQNEHVFIDLFIDFLKSIDDPNDVEFEGEGAYYGRQVNISKDRNYKIKRDFAFEIAYDMSYKISVYTDRHEGFWYPEYIKMDVYHPRFDELKTALFNCLKTAFGL